MSTALAQRRLIPHPDCLAPAIDLSAKVALVGADVLKLEYIVVGDVDRLRLPPPGIPDRADQLWRHSCFEAFIALGDSGAYVEYNFAPSRQWASYRFEGYRKGMQAAMDLPQPDICVEKTSSHQFTLIASIELSPLASASPTGLGLSAVIEERSGRKSYWALAHPRGAPDFHHEDCFALDLPASSPRT